MSPSPTRRTLITHPRHGSLIPAVAIAVLVAGGCVALVLDRLWLASVHRELQAVADAAALAAAARLAEDDLLLPGFDGAARADAVRRTAAEVASSHVAAGQRVSVNPSPFADVRLGRIVMNQETGLPQFLETETAPMSVLVTAHCDRSHRNPVSLFFPQLTGQPTADVAALAEATIDNHVVGLRPMDFGPVPAWPLAVLEGSADLSRADTWVRQIEHREGSDRFGFDAARRQVVEQPDGLPEVRLFTSKGRQGQRPNVCLLDVGTGLYETELQRQFKTGWRWQDCQESGGQLLLGDGNEREFSALSEFSASINAVLAGLVGQARIVVLYREIPSAQGPRSGRVMATRFAAGRIMHVSSTPKGTELVLQPTVVTTRTALVPVALPMGPATRPVTANPYIYRLSLSY